MKRSFFSGVALIALILCSTLLGAQTTYPHPSGQDALKVRGNASHVYGLFDNGDIVRFNPDASGATVILNDVNARHFNITATNLYVLSGMNLDRYDLAGNFQASEPSVGGDFDHLATGERVQIDSMTSDLVKYDVSGTSVIASVAVPDDAFALAVDLTSQWIAVVTAAGSNNVKLYDSDLTFICNVTAPQAVAVAFDGGRNLFVGRSTTVSPQFGLNADETCYQVSTGFPLGALDHASYGPDKTLIVQGGQILGYLGGVPLPVVLPVELMSFTADTDGKMHQLEWETVQELNFSHFEVERSFGGRRWENIRRVSGQGNEGSYKLEVTPESRITHYYRLKMVDLDGSFEFSKIASISAKTHTEEIEIFPNPSTGVVNISTEVNLFSPTGSFVRSLNKGDHDLSRMPRGVYVLKSPSGEVARLLIH